jgi:hypothetical protein
VLCALGLTALAVVTLGRHVTETGFIFDDWRIALVLRDTPGGVWDAVQALADLYEMNIRPVLAVLVPVVHELLGLNQAAHMAFTVALGVAATVGFYAVLRVARLPVAWAASAAVLSFVFPFSDSYRLWAAGGLNELAMVFVAAGVLASAAGLQRAGRGTVVFHALGAVMWAAGVATHEAVVGLTFVSWIVYVRVAPVRPSLLRGVADVAAVLFDARKGQSTSGTIDHAIEIVKGGAELIVTSMVPGLDAGPALAVLAVGAVLLALGARRTNAPLRPALLLMAAGIVTALSGWMAFAPADSFYGPLRPGEGNRTNAVADTGIVLIVVGAAVAAAEVLARLLRARAEAVFLVLVLLVGAGYAEQLGSHSRDWIRAHTFAQRALDVTGQSDVPDGSFILMFGVPSGTAHSIPVFAFRGDLTAALQLSLHRPMAAEPIKPESLVECRPEGVFVAGGDFARTNVERYGRVVFLDVTRRESLPVRSARACEAALPRFLKGLPLVEA